MKRMLYRPVSGGRRRIAVINRIQSVVLGFFGCAWISLVVILFFAPPIFDGATKLPSGRDLLAVGATRRLRWASC